MTAITNIQIQPAPIEITPLMKRIAIAYVALWSERANRAVLRELLKRQDYLLRFVSLRRADIERALRGPITGDAAVLLMQFRSSHPLFGR